jgi:acyl-CoA thioesterase FadM
MRHDAWRLDAAQYPFTTPIEPRFSDVDTLRHLNNSALHGLHQEARVRCLTQHIGDAFWRERGPRLLARRVVTEFLLESQYPEGLTGAVRVTAADGQQLTVGSALFQQGRCVGLQSTVLQASLQGKACPMPAVWRAALVPTSTTATSEGHAAPGGDATSSPTLDSLPQRRELDTRYADLDPTGRVSEGAWMRAAESGRSGLLREAFATLGDDADRAWLGLLVARVDLHVLRHAPPPPRWQLGAGITHLGRSSAVARVAFFDGPAGCAAYADCVLVFVDRAAGGSVPMPDPVRAALQARRVKG